MKIKKGFVIEKVADSYLACATGKLASQFSGFIKLNETGVFLWNQLSDKDMTADELTAALIAEYEVDLAIASADVSAFVKKLEANGIVE